MERGEKKKGEGARKGGKDGKTVRGELKSPVKEILNASPPYLTWIRQLLFLGIIIALGTRL